MIRKNVMMLVMAGLLMGGWVAQAQARVTEKVDAMIEENTENLKIKDMDIWVQLGGPLIAGIQFDKYVSPHVALGVGVGNFIGGTALDMTAKYYFLRGRFSPFIAGGGVYYLSRPQETLFAVHATAGLAYFFDSGLGLSMGLTGIQGISKSAEPFSYQYIDSDTTLSQGGIMPQFGIHWNF